MNKDSFTTMNNKRRVEIVNEMLKKEGNDLRRVADRLGIKYSTFTKLMQEDDYVYIKRLGMYCKFVQDENLIKENRSEIDQILDYIKENFEILQALIENKKENNDFVLDKRIYQSSSKPVTKNFRISDEIYKSFAETCENQLPYLKLQDIIAQLLLNFVDKYSRTN